MPKMVLNVLSLSKVEHLHFFKFPTCGYDPELEAGSR
jgi:hypothetical protein